MSNSAAATVLLLCDATQRQGLGHFMRCVSLAQAAEASGWDVHFAGTIEEPLAVRVLSEHNYTVHGTVGADTELLTLGAKLGANLVHVDRYDGFRDLGHGAGSVVTSTATDGAFGRRRAQVIVDGSPKSLERFDSYYSTADVALGPRFLAVRADLGRFSQGEPHSSDAPKVLVMMGGTDPAGYGAAVAAAVSALPGIAEIGLAGPDLELSGVVPVPRNPDLQRMVEPWDVVVTAAGSTVWELASMGVPMGVIGTAENQRDQYEWLTASGIAVGLGFQPRPLASRIHVDDLAEFLANPGDRANAINRGQIAVDGNGADRIVETWRATLADRAYRSLALRSAGTRDAGRLFDWRNDANSRDSSRNSDLLVWSDHIGWLRNSLHRLDRLLYIGVANGEPIGTVRFDEVIPGEWEISIAVAPSARGQGYANRLVELGNESLTAEIGNVQVVRAVIRTSNAVSAAVFSRLKFKKVHVESSWETWIYRF